MEKTSSNMKSTLTTYFGRYFDNVDVTVSYEQIPEDTNQVNLILYVFFIDKLGKEFVLGRAIEVLNSKISKIISINNTGS